MAIPESQVDQILVNESQAAKLLGICGKSVYNLRKSGQLPFVQINSSTIRYRVDALQQFVNSRETRLPSN